ncbi:zinc-binding dehydrogenase family oxidoreductase [Hypoxylon rubiginosum]|uniref:Zinc-binding dehydrogenase family oxidoreductase n=1 Tax=Hypoxylon rubiginosum TaxID=110542 RepID=A0ACC0D051_9PEZI|nr:zinc-binding dehydrogenase family oxidoreductase [Hypoxylon rubiginosum]
MTSHPSLPALQRAVIQDANGRAQAADNLPLPQLFPGTVLVKTMAISLNPSDYKMGNRFPSPGSVIGNDFAGAVVAIGPKTSTALSVGDLVFGMVHGSNPADGANGAFAQYVRVPSEFALRVPTGWRPEQAAALGVGLVINCLALWGNALALEPCPDSPAQEPIPVLVYGGSTATGTMAIQLLRLSNLDPIATCSPRNFDMVKGYGAATVFDYSQPDTAERIRKHTGGQLSYALDCITDRDSVGCCYASIGRTGGRYVCLELCAQELQTRRAVKANFPIAYEIFGEDIQLSGGYERKGNRKTRADAVNWFNMLQGLLDEGKLRTHPLQVLTGGLDGIPKGLDLLKSGAVSGKKLVVLIDP